MMLLSCIFNLSLAWKIFTRPNLQNIFNVSLAGFFGCLGFAGPLLVLLYFETFDNLMFSGNIVEMEDKRRTCARFFEMRKIVYLSEQVIANNILFRFFLIVHADKGFVKSGVYNSGILKNCFIIYTVFFVIYSYLPWIAATALEENYPENTVKGRICLGLRLDWDKDNTKETSDIYVKPRMIVIILAIMSYWFCCHFCGYRAKQFVKGFCISQKTFANIGGKQRRNILNYKEVCCCHTVVLISILLESSMFIMFYFFQDLLGNIHVFLMHFLYSLIADFSLIILFPASVLYQSFYGYPELWTRYVPKPLKFYSFSHKIYPRRCQSDFDIHKEKEECQLLKRSIHFNKKKTLFSKGKQHVLTKAITMPIILEDLPTINEEMVSSVNNDNDNTDQNRYLQWTRSYEQGKSSLTSIDI